VRATSAVTDIFQGNKMWVEFCNAAFGTNNHCEVLVDEVARALPNKEIACLLRIDTGLSRAVEIMGNLVPIVHRRLEEYGHKLKSRP
jgi:hypothetical protein